MAATYSSTTPLMRGRAGSISEAMALGPQKIGIAHQVLVSKIEHAAGQHGVPVRRDPPVAAAVIAPELGQVVREMGPLDELPLVARKAGIQRVAGHVHDRRLRQHHMDEADPTEVEGHLVGDAGRVPAVDLDRLHVGRAQRVPGLAPDRAETFGKRQGAAGLAPGLEPPVDQREVAQLAGPRHRRCFGFQAPELVSWIRE